MDVKFKTVNDGEVKGLIITAETLVDIENVLVKMKDKAVTSRDDNIVRGAVVLLDTLKDAYSKIQ